ncbi:MAG: hypothetical protein KDC12_09280 [Flavobacteriales bacterium]|nr:hypothetical protein [Flavobacteriales bacterium]
MRIAIALTALLATFISTSAQQLLTIGETYDFEPGDEFHFKHTTSAPPNAQRFVVADKYYSDGGLTVNYIRDFSNYSSVFVTQPEPHLEYTFWTYTDTVQYTKLDNTVNTLEYGPEYDYFESYTTPLYCDSLMNELQFITLDLGVEFDLYSVVYGKGLGRTFEQFEPADPVFNSGYSWHMFYYQKNGEACGTPDTLTTFVSVTEMPAMTITLAPNPVTDELHLSASQHINATCWMMDASGRTVETVIINGTRCGINTQNLPIGLYYLFVDAPGMPQIFRFLKE